MIKKIIVSYFLNIKYLLVAMGIIYFFLIICSIAFFKQILYLLNNFDKDTINNLKNYILNVLDNESLFSLIKKDHLNKFKEDINLILGDQIVIINKDLSISLYIGVLSFLLTINLSLSLCKFLLRKDSNMQKEFISPIAFLFRLLVSFIFGSIFVFLINTWQIIRIIVIIIYSLFLLFENIITTYFIYFKKVPFKMYFHSKNLLYLSMIYLSIAIVHSLILFIVYLLLGKLGLFLVLIPLYTFSFALFDYYTIYYYQELFKKIRFIFD